MNSKIIDLVNEMEDEIISDRRDFHMYPESGWKEVRTGSIVARRLSELGYDVFIGKDIMNASDMMGLPSKDELDKNYHRAINQGADMEFAPMMKDGFTSVMGIIENGEGPTVALRFDMDAVDCNESDDTSHSPAMEGFSSVNKDSMHACGHDSHTAIGLGAAKVISELIGNFSGRIKLIFQGAEEGVRGAKCIVSKGVLDDVDYLYGMHIGAGAEDSGTLICGVSGFLATEKLDAEFFGVSSHAGMSPEEGCNAILAACTAVSNLHSISRHSDGISRVNVGKIQGGTGRNVIPNYAKIVLEVRGSNNKILDYMNSQAERVIGGAASIHGCDCKIKKMGSAQSASSDYELVSQIKRVAQDNGIFKEIEENSQMSGSEDFTYMMNRVQENGGKASYIALGTKIKAPHHNDKFDIVESDLKNGVVLLTSLVNDLLNKF